MTAERWALIAGVFVGNFFIHWYQTSIEKGLAVGSIAAVLVFGFWMFVILIQRCYFGPKE